VVGNLRNLAVAERRAATDGLTGLASRRAVEETFKRMVSQAGRTLSPLTLLMLDLDHFKHINDEFGHGRGDEVLAAAAAAITGAVRSSDFAGRYGGEEFVVLLPETTAEGGRVIAEKIRTAVAGLRVPAVSRPITVSIGVAALPEHARDTETLQRAADRALYAAKNAGRNRVVVFHQVAGSDADHQQPAGSSTSNS
jgi:diguanylate cyclase (GGDEF)-like protein